MSGLSGGFGRRQFLTGAAGVGALTAIGGLSGCGSSSSSGSKAGSGQQTVSLMLDYLPNPDDVFVQVGKDSGYYADEGIAIKPTVPPSNLELVPELVGRGQFDMGLSYAVNVTAARNKGIPIISVAGAAIRADGLISVSPNVVHDGHDLVGKTVATYASPDYVGFMTSVMRSAGLKLSDLKLVDVAFTPPVIASGKAFAGVGLRWGEYIGTEDAAKRQTNFVSFFDPKFNIPPNQPYLSFITSEKFAHDHPDTVKAVIRASMRSIKKSLVDSSAARNALLPWCSTGPKAVGTIATNVKEFNAQRPYWFPAGTDPSKATYGQQDLTAWSKASTWLQSVGGIDKIPEPSSYVVNDFLTPGATQPSV